MVYKGTSPDGTIITVKKSKQFDSKKRFYGHPSLTDFRSHNSYGRSKERCEIISIACLAVRRLKLMGLFFPSLCGVAGCFSVFSAF